MRRSVAFALALLSVTGEAAARSGSEDWIVANTGTALLVQEAGRIAVSGTEMIGADSLTYDIRYDWPWFTVPEGEARFVAFYDPFSARVSKAALIFSDAAPACGAEVGVMLVDTGTGAFLDRTMATALDRLAADMGDDCNLYDCMMAAQVPDADFARLIRLPDGTVYPAFTTGWGDGIYPVVTLHDAEGGMTAVYADFMGRNAAGETLMPSACGTG